MISQVKISSTFTLLKFRLLLKKWGESHLCSPTRMPENTGVCGTHVAVYVKSTISSEWLQVKCFNKLGQGHPRGGKNSFRLGFVINTQMLKIVEGKGEKGGMRLRPCCHICSSKNMGFRAFCLNQT